MAYTGLAHGGTPIPPPLLPCPVVSCRCCHRIVCCRRTRTLTHSIIIKMNVNFRIRTSAECNHQMKRTHLGSPKKHISNLCYPNISRFLGSKKTCFALEKFEIADVVNWSPSFNWVEMAVQHRLFWLLPVPNMCFRPQNSKNDRGAEIRGTFMWASLAHTYTY